MQNDDIVHAHSGKTIEGLSPSMSSVQRLIDWHTVNNTDAEGRMVLADGVSYATKTIKPTHMFTVATLTGAQMVTTGNLHAAILSNDEGLESLVQKAGRSSGDWTHPILYAPQIVSRTTSPILYAYTSADAFFPSSSRSLTAQWQI